MTESGEWMRRAAREEPILPAGIDVSVPSVARVYDYALGGKDNYAADREAAELVLNLLPGAEQMALDNRAFLRRAVRYLVGEAGIRQIVDIGSGLPTAGNVHEIAHEIAPKTRVVYVDNDPIVLAHGRALLADEQTTTVITADVRDPDAIFGNRDIGPFIDQSQPFAVLLASILHHLPDEDDPVGVVAAIRERIPSGGYLMTANFYDSGDPRAVEMERVSLEEGLGTGRFRTWEEQRPYFDGLELVEPGLVMINEWRPDSETLRDSPVHSLYLGGVGRRP